MVGMATLPNINTTFHYNIYVQYIKSLGANDFDIMVGGEEQHFHRNGV